MSPPLSIKKILVIEPPIPIETNPPSFIPSHTYSLVLFVLPLKIEPIFPVNIMLPSLIILALEELDISPSVTFEPATLPAPETLNISKICAVPVTVS